MQVPRSRRLAALLLIAATMLLTCGAASASATPGVNASATEACGLPKPNEDETISILGRICDEREDPATGIPGVRVTVEDASGNPLGEATSASDGTFQIDLPGPAIDHLGKSSRAARSRSTSTPTSP